MTSVIIAGMGLRNNIRIPNPNTSLQVIFEDFCRKNKLNPVDHALFDPRSKKPIDLTLTFRLSGIVQKATLEVRKVKRVARKKKRKSTCKIALATPDGKRLISSKILISSSILEVLFFMEREHHENLSTRTTTDDNNNTYLQPVVVFMQRKFGNLEQLSSTKLISLGIKKNQSVLLRLSFTPNKSLDEEVDKFINMIIGIRDEFYEKIDNIMTPKPKLSKKEEIFPQQQKKNDDDIIIPPPPPIQKKKEKKKEEVEGEEEEEKKNDDDDDYDYEKILPVEGEVRCRNVKLYRFGSGEKTSMEDIDDSEFDPSLRNLKLFPMESGKEELLKTDRIRKLEEKKKKKMEEKKRRRKNKKEEVFNNDTIIRVRFRNGLLLQGTFLKTDSLEEVSKMVRNSILCNSQDREGGPPQAFQFHIAPPVRKFREDESYLSLESLGLFPAVLLNCSSCDDNHPLRFKQEVVEKYLQDLKEDDEERKKSKKRKRKQEEQEEQEQEQDQKKLKMDNKPPQSSSSKPSKKRSDGKPSWFRIGKK